MMQPFVAQPVDHVTPATTAFVVDGLGVLGLGALLVLALVRRGVHRHREKLALKAALRQGEPLHLGPSVLAGTVVDESEGDAIVIAIEQRGREWRTKGGWHHRWSEQHRSVEVKPFYVARANGERVRVEPDSQVFLVDALDDTERLGPDRRVRRARLSPGEHVFILGGMTRAPDPKQGGYRESADGWVLRPLRGARMLISTEPLEDRHRRRARVWRNLALTTAALMLLWHGLLFIDVHGFRWMGRPVTATAVDKHWWRTWVRPSKGSPYWAYHYEVAALGDDGVRRTARVGATSYQAIETTDGSRPGTELAFLVVDGQPQQVQIGNRACAGIGSTLFGFVLATGLLIFYLAYAAATQPWWERRRVVEEGPGHLQ